MKPEFNLITKRSSLMEAFPNFGKRFLDLDLSQYGVKAEEAEFIQKGITSSDLKFEEGERAVISTITGVIRAVKDQENFLKKLPDKNIAIMDATTPIRTIT